MSLNDLNNIKEAHRKEATKIYTFSFKRYEKDRIEKHSKLWHNKMKLRLSIFGFSALFFVLMGNIYPIMMWFEYDINMYRPRVSNYILNRLG